MSAGSEGETKQHLAFLQTSISELSKSVERLSASQNLIVRRLNQLEERDRNAILNPSGIPESDLADATHLRHRLDILESNLNAEMSEMKLQMGLPSVRQEDGSTSERTQLIGRSASAESIGSSGPSYSISSQTDTLAKDCWSAMILVIIGDFPHLATGHAGLESVVRVLNIVTLLIVNVFLQVMLVYWIAKHTVFPEVASVQRVYQKFHSDAFRSGQFDQAAFDSFGPFQADVCGIAMAQELFMMSCLFVWSARCLAEIRVAGRQASQLYLLPPLSPRDSSASMIQVVEGAPVIVALSFAAKAWISICVIIPRALVAVGMLVVGITFLTATSDFPSLILNSLAMAFVTDIDELIVNTFLPLRMQHRLQGTKIGVMRRAMLFNWSSIAQSYMTSTVSLVSVIVGLVIWLTYQQVIPGYQWDVGMHCKAYLESTRQILCQPLSSEDCFPKS